MYYTNIKHYTTIREPKHDHDESIVLCLIAVLAVLISVVVITA